MKKSILSAIGMLTAVCIISATPMQAEAGILDWFRGGNQDIVVNTGEAYTTPMMDVAPVGGEGTTQESIFKANQYYYKTGKSCPEEATYSKYRLTEVCKRGDIIYEAMGAGGLAGHIAIVEGVYDRGDGRKYVRLIESIGDGGTVRSILDDKRADVKAAYILRVKGADEGLANRATNFCASQLGKRYKMDLRHDYSMYEAHWYCSEMVWAAYFNQGINVETTGSLNETGVTPRDIYRGNMVTVIPYK